MLPTKDKSNIFLEEDKTLTGYNHEQRPTIHGIGQHLYITSDEEIKEGFTGFAIVTVKDDSRIHYLVTIIITEQNQCYCEEDRKFSFQYYSVKSLITTTHNLDTTGYKTIPAFVPFIPHSFIQLFIDKYNRGGVITKIKVEYYCHYEEDTSNSYTKDGGQPAIRYEDLIVNSRNCITIKSSTNYLIN